LHYLKRDWHQRKSLKVGDKNVQHPALSEWHKILLQHLNFKLDLMKDFVKTMDLIGLAFKYPAEEFPGLSETKIKRGGFYEYSDPQALQIDIFNNLLQSDEKKASNAIHLVSTNLLRNTGAENYKELIEDMLSLYDKLGCCIFIISIQLCLIICIKGKG
jgi:hypothetical protein